MYILAIALQLAAAILLVGNTDIKPELNARILNRLIEKILVHQRGVDKDGRPMQVIEIYYRFIGRTEIDLYDLLCPAA